MTNHPEQRRLAEILVDRSSGETNRGSGYLVAPGWLVTAEHNFADATRVRVWLGAPAKLDPLEASVISCDQILRLPHADLALVPIPSAEPTGVQSKVLFGRLDRGSAGTTPVVAAGFPRFKLRAAPHQPALRLREVHYATGSIAVGSNVKTGTFEFVVEVTPVDTDPAHSPWEGMSGAAVFASGRMIGVVGQHYPTESSGVLTVRPLSALFHSDSDDIDRWRQALPQLASGADDLGVVSTPSERELVVRRAQRAAVSLSPTVLVAREKELALLRSFVDSAQRCLWLQGAAFAGKTALLAWFAIHQPPDVDVAACFLRRTAGAADAHYAFDVLCKQLAVHAGRHNYESPTHLSQGRDDLLDLLVEASAASADRGHRLLLIVDGLDEYQAEEPGLAIGTWLPGTNDTLPNDTQLLVASRMGINIDLPAQHPLRRSILRIDPSSAAKEIEHLAEMELAQARTNADSLIYELLGMLTAGHTGLAYSDITELVQHQGQPRITKLQVADILRSDLSRSIVEIGSLRGIDQELLVFAHDTLLENARNLFQDVLPHHRRRLIEWADEYAAKHWPPDTPTYLLVGYLQLLKELTDVERLYALATDIHRHDRLFEATGGDAAALTEITTALQILADQSDPDLARICLLARARDTLLDRNNNIPEALLGAWIHLGHFNRAEAAAQSRPNRVEALVYVSTAMAKAGHISRAVEVASTVTDALQKDRVLATIAQTVAQTGDFERAAAIAATITDTSALAEVLATIAQTVAQTGDFERAAAIAATIADPYQQVEVLATIAQTVAQAGDTEHATELADRAAAIAATIVYPYQQVEVLATIAQTVAQTGDFERAAAIAATITDTSTQAEVLATIGRTVAQAGDIEHATGLIDRAVEITDCLSSGYWRARTIATIAKSVAQAGDTARAIELIDRAIKIAATSPDERMLATVVESVIQAGEPEHAVEIAATITNDVLQARVLASVAKSVAQAGDTERAIELIDRAIKIALTIFGGLQAEVLATIAESAVQAGDTALAAAVADTITKGRPAIEPTAVNLNRRDAYAQARALARIAQSVAEAGEIDRAVEITATIADPYQQVEVLATIAQTVAQAGDTEHATELADRAADIAATITDASTQARVLATTAQTVAHTGDFDRAAEVAATITDASTQARVLATIAQTVAQAGDAERAAELADRAIEVAASITDAWRQAKVLATIAESVARAGDFDRAAEIAATITDAYQKAEVLAIIAKSAAQAGDTERAANFIVAARISGANQQAGALATIAQTVAEAGETEYASELFDRAIRIALTITNDPLQAQALATIAKSVAQAGDTARAIELIDRAIKIARAVTDDSGQVQVLATIAESVAQVGDTESAEEIVRRILSTRDRNTRPIVQLAARLIPMGHPDLAKRILAHAWIGMDWSVPLEVLPTIDLPAARTVVRELS